MNPLQQNTLFCFLFAQLGRKLVPGKSEEARISHFKVLWSSLKLLKFPKPPGTESHDPLVPKCYLCYTRGDVCSICTID
jgi:hypothetical protein